METIGANQQSIQDTYDVTMWAFALRLAAKLCDRGFGDQVNSTATYVCKAMKESMKRCKVASAHRRTTSVESDANWAPLLLACEKEHRSIDEASQNVLPPEGVSAAYV